MGKTGHPRRPPNKGKAEDSWGGDSVWDAVRSIASGFTGSAAYQPRPVGFPAPAPILDMLKMSHSSERGQAPPPFSCPPSSHPSRISPWDACRALQLTGEPQVQAAPAPPVQPQIKVVSAGSLLRLKQHEVKEGKLVTTAPLHLGSSSRPAPATCSLLSFFFLVPPSFSLSLPPSLSPHHHQPLPPSPLLSSPRCRVPLGTPFCPPTRGPIA